MKKQQAATEMKTTAVATADAANGKKMLRRKNTKKFFSLLFGRKIVIAAIIGLVLFALIAIFANLVAPYDPNAASLYDSNQAPSWAHLLGTDNLGRDTLSRLMYGSRVSLLVGLVATIVAAIVGTFFGMTAAFFGGWVDTVIMRLCEALMSIPYVIFAMSLITIFGKGTVNMALILGTASVPVFIRMMRAQTLTIKQRDYIKAGQTQGAKNYYLMVRHIIPNAISPIIVQMSQMVGVMILMESGLSYLGVGISIPVASWGTMIADGKTYMTTNPVMAFAPGVCIALLVICLNVVGDGIRDAMDPRLRGEL